MHINIHYNKKYQLFLQLLPWFIITYGVFVRFNQYLFNRPMALDELFIASSIADGSFLDFFKPLDYSHRVPPLFLILTKLPIIIFTNNDLFIRLFPFIAGTLSLLLFYKLASKTVSYTACIVSLLLFSTNEYMIFFTTELKQYSTDVCIALLIFLMVIHLQSKQLKPWKIVMLCFTGIIAVWSSHPAIFVLAGCGTYMFMSDVFNRDWKRARKLIVVYLVWVINFIVFYAITLKGMDDYPVHNWLIKFWIMEDAFAPFSLSFFKWSYTMIVQMIKMLGGYETNLTHYTAVILFFVGCISVFFRKNKFLWALVLPLLFAVGASLFQAYPVYDRMALFFLPSILIIMAEGACCIWIKSIMWTRLIPAILIILIVYQPLNHSFYRLKEPIRNRELKHVMKYVSDNIQPNDIIYLYYWAEPAFRYYDEFYGFDFDNFVLISPKPDLEYVKEVDHFRNNKGIKRIDGFNIKYKRILGVHERIHGCKDEIDQLIGNKRVWFLFSHSSVPKFKKYICEIGEKRDVCIRRIASAWLIDLSVKEKSE